MRLIPGRAGRRAVPFLVVLYASVVLLPLALAAFQGRPAGPGFGMAFGAAIGLIAFPLIAVQLGLVARLKSVSRMLGVDALLQFHRAMGCAALALAAAHALLFAWHGTGVSSLSPLRGGALTRTGALALWLLVLLVVTSLARRRLRLSYETWNLLHLLAALGIVGAMLAHVLLAGGAAAPLARGVFMGYATAAGAMLAWHRLGRPALMWFSPWVVAENRDEGADTRTLRVCPDGQPGIGFQDGQFAWLCTARQPFFTQQHPVTISCSASREVGGCLEFTIKALGDWSGRVVPSLANGDRIWLDGPYGAVSPARFDCPGLVLIAGGIGISPMRSILLTMRDSGDRRSVYLFYAANDRSRTVFAGELESLTRELDLSLVYVLEEPAPGSGDESGYVSADLMRRHLPDDFPRFHYFVCGPVPMMKSVDRQLLAMGVPESHVHSERFDVV